MAIQIPNLGSGDGLTGDNELVIRQKYNANFIDNTHAASRLVGKAAGNVMEVGAFGLGGYSSDYYPDSVSLQDMPNGFFRYPDESTQIPSKMGQYDTWGINIKRHQSAQG